MLVAHDVLCTTAIQAMMDGKCRGRMRGRGSSLYPMLPRLILAVIAEDLRRRSLNFVLHHLLRPPIFPSLGGLILN
jgi:hypothetical protein